jgi:isoquinoline 1-oxidoreductase beta subunit
MDPIAFRMKHMQDPREVDVVKAAAEKLGWSSKVNAGRKPTAKVMTGRGMALHSGYQSYAAVACEVQVHRVTVAADLGHMVNPDTVEAQLQSSIIFGMGAALKHQITMTNGRVQQTNYHDFQPVRMNEAPKIDIVLVKSTEKPGGIGEPATAVVAPAIANAVAMATGARIRSLPLSPPKVLAAIKAKGRG